MVLITVKVMSIINDHNCGPLAFKTFIIIMYFIVFLNWDFIVTLIIKQRKFKLSFNTY